MKSTDLARLAEISPSALSAIEGGYGSSQPALDAVCKALELNEKVAR